MLGLTRPFPGLNSFKVSGLGESHSRWFEVFNARNILDHTAVDTDLDPALFTGSLVQTLPVAQG